MDMQSCVCVIFLLFKIYLIALDLSCSPGTLRCGTWDLVLRPGIEPRPPALGVWGLRQWTTREASQPFVFLMSIFWMIFCHRGSLVIFSCSPCSPPSCSQHLGTQECVRRSTLPAQAPSQPPPLGPQSIGSWLVSGSAQLSASGHLQGPWQPRSGGPCYSWGLFSTVPSWPVASLPLPKHARQIPTSGPLH